jgi:hypothetical protein
VNVRVRVFVSVALASVYAPSLVDQSKTVENEGGSQPLRVFGMMLRLFDR